MTVNLPSGYIGLATSKDGKVFKKTAGGVGGGAVLGPNADTKAFDSLHLGIGDIVVSKKKQNIIKNTNENSSNCFFYFLLRSENCEP